MYATTGTRHKVTNIHTRYTLRIQFSPLPLAPVLQAQVYGNLGGIVPDERDRDLNP